MTVPDVVACLSTATAAAGLTDAQQQLVLVAFVTAYGELIVAEADRRQFDEIVAGGSGG